jgi:energy-coupling factor transporter transmembrane protein EcfT
MLFLGQKNSTILNSSEVVDISCSQCGLKSTTSFHHFISYVCFNFGIPLFPWKSNIISDCSSCQFSVAEEDFSPELKQAYNSSTLPQNVPFKYYAFGIIIGIIAFSRILYVESYKGTTPIIFVFFQILFMIGMIWLFSIAFKRLGKNPYLAFLSLIPAVGYLIVIGILIYYYTQKDNPTIQHQSYQDNVFSSQPTLSNTNQKKENSSQSKPNSSKTLDEQDYNDLINKNLELKPIEYSYFLETIMYNLVWYIRIHELNPADFNLDRLIKQYQEEEKMLIACRNSALTEELDNLTAIIEERNEKITNNYKPKSIDILLQYIIFFHAEQGWILGNFTEQTRKLLRTLNIPKLTMMDYWFSNSKRLGLDLNNEQKKEFQNEFKDYNIHNIFYSYYFYADTILLLQMWYLQKNGYNSQKFDLELFKDKYPDSKLRLELMYWDLHDKSLDYLTLKVKSHIAMTLRKFNRNYRENMLYEIGLLQKQKAWKENFYTDATGELLGMFGYPSLQCKTLWRDMLNISPDSKIIEKIKEQSDSQVIASSISDSRFMIEESYKHRFFIITTFFTNVWYIRENGLQPEEFDLVNSTEEMNEEIFKDQFNKDIEKINIEELEYMTFGRLRTLAQYFEPAFQQNILKEVAKLHKQKSWILSEFTEITNDLLDIMNIKEEHKQELWNNILV